MEILHGNVLQISGDNNMKDEGMRGRWHLTERAHGKFLRTFQLPNDSNLKKFRTRDKNGVIIINIPKNLLVRTVVISDIPSYVLTWFLWSICSPSENTNWSSWKRSTIPHVYELSLCHYHHLDVPNIWHYATFQQCLLVFSHMYCVSLHNTNKCEHHTVALHCIINHWYHTYYYRLH